MEESKQDWICKEPFTYAEVFSNSTYMCCPQWLPEELGDPKTIAENWKSDKANKIRESIVDGSYRFCKEDVCPKLNGLKQGKTDGFIHKSNFNKELYLNVNTLPIHIRYSFDSSCNLKCPSCRLDFINFEGEDRINAEELIEILENQIGPNVEKIDCTGSGDPFFSRTFKKWLMNLDKSKYPKLKHIHLHTNATLWNESNWIKVKNAQEYIKSCEISIDAATKETYENFTRLGGKWDKLIDNLNFISTLSQLEYIQASFVVQQSNYHEMIKFYNLINSIFGKTSIRWRVFYNRINDWKVHSKEDFKKLDVADNNHPEHLKYREIFKQLPINNYVMHNLPNF